MPERITLSDVARAAGVSLKTASRALGGEPYVTDDTRRRVLEHAAHLGYERNAAASLLASGRRTDVVGFITGDLSNPFYSIVARGLENGLRERTMHLSVASSGESAEREWDLAQGFAATQARALVVASARREHAAYASVQARGIPVVFVDRPPESIAADSVVWDDRTGGALAAGHLVERGHRRIAFVGDYAWLPTTIERLAGIGDVLDPAGIAWRDLVRTGAHEAAGAGDRVEELLALPDPPTAIVAGNNRIMLGVAARMSATPLASRPALVGFDDFEWSEVLGATVVTGDAEEMGCEAARLALARMSDRDRPVDVRVLPMRLIPRGSGERGPV